MVEMRDSIIEIMVMAIAVWFSLMIWLWFKPSKKKEISCEFSFFGSKLSVRVAESPNTEPEVPDTDLPQ